MTRRIPYYRNCRKPWEEFIIHADLSYSPCCYGPKVGKIRSVDEIDDLWNGKVIRRIRRDLLRGILNPMCMNCSMYKVVNNSPEVVVPDDWVHPYETEISPAIKRMNILITEKCNLACIMCNATGIYNNRIKEGAFIPFEFIRRLGERYFADLEFLNPNCFGEFFLYKDFPDYLDLVQKYRPKRVEFITNGSLSIKEDVWLRILQTHTCIGFSIDAATRQTYQLIRRKSNWDNVHRNYEIVRNLRKQYGLTNELRFNFVIMKINLHELYPFVEKSLNEWGANGVTLMHVDGDKNVRRHVLNDPEYRVLYNQHLMRIYELRKKHPDFFISDLDYAYDGKGHIEGLDSQTSGANNMETGGLSDLEKVKQIIHQRTLELDHERHELQERNSELAETIKSLNERGKVLSLVLHALRMQNDEIKKCRLEINHLRSIGGNAACPPIVNG